jgi:hypothetical protein
MEFWRHQFPDLLKWENELINNGWKFVGSGRHRRVLKRKNYVIKIPWQIEGVQANINEARLYNRYKQIYNNTRHYAPCKLIKNNCLIMKAVDIIDPFLFKEFDEYWVFYLKDGAQVGYDKQGNLLAFDYSDE